MILTVEYYTFILEKIVAEILMAGEGRRRRRRIHGCFGDVTMPLAEWHGNDESATSSLKWGVNAVDPHTGLPLWIRLNHVEIQMEWMCLINQHLARLELWNCPGLILCDNMHNMANLTHLTIAQGALTTLPRSFGRLSQLRVLQLHSNRFETVPVCIRDLDELAHLTMSGNLLRQLPDQLPPRLHTLDVSQNQLTELPSTMFESLLQLTHLYVSSNQLKHLPDTLPGSLICLVASDNQLTGMPAVPLPALERLVVNANHITIAYGDYPRLNYMSMGFNRIQRWSLTTLLISDLTTLCLAKNELTVLPDTIRRLINLEYFYLSSNRLTALPDSISEMESLMRLYVSDNLLTELPASICRMPKLRVLDVSKNRLRELPPMFYELRQQLELFSSDLR